MKSIRVRRTRTRILVGAALSVAALSIWLVRHIYSSINTWQGRGQHFATVYALAFLLLMWQCVLYFCERPRKVTPEQQGRLDELRVTVPVPVRNEGPNAFKACLASIADQARLPQCIVVVENDNSVDYAAVRSWFAGVCGERGIPLIWESTPVPGKRHAQGLALAAARRAGISSDVYVTVDSDANLDRQAIDEILKPFADREIQSVAGIVLASNLRGNVNSKGQRRRWRDALVRLTDLWFVVGQLVDRSAQSALGGVLVNSGVLAAYRAHVVDDNLDGYLNETFLGRKVEFSDDSMLTIYALQHGKAVQQPTAFATTLMPDNFSQLFRMYTRWMRGAFIRTFWRFRYLRLDNYAYWGHLIGWIQMALSTVIFIALFLYLPFVRGVWTWELLLIPVLVGYGQALRYLGFRRSDESFGAQLLTFAAAPVAQIFAFTVFRVVRWYAMATCYRTGWGTRQKVELDLVSSN
ncbi:glycosyltransferase [Streptomyces sp. PTD9-10]|uniref:glycosyltransferase n=1 Tax=Streptomyces sp. PTD9-10 TaxID=3120151 RepID=UPI00300A6EE8